MKNNLFCINLEKTLAMLPISTVLFALSCFTPLMVNSFVRFSCFSKIGVAARLDMKKHRPCSIVQASTSVDRVEIENMTSVIVGAAALEKLAGAANYVRSPMSEKNQFLQWAKQTTERKWKTDKEFGEKVKVRELKKLHSETIKRLENAVDVSKEKYLLNSNSVLINELDRVILNCLQATRNMESFLAKTPLESNDVPTSAIIQTTHNVGEGSTAETRFRIDPALTATVEHLVYSEAINDLTTVEGDAMDAGVEIMYDDAATKEAATDKGAIKRLHIARIYPQKKLELLKNQLEREELLKSTPEYVDYTKSQKELLNFFEEIGLNKAEKDVKSVQKGAGKGRNSRGRTFEDTADSVITDHLLPRLALIHNCKIEDLIVIRNLKFGMASNKGSTAELDSVICIRSDRPARITAMKTKGSFCKVLAVVEVKRNPDDLGHAFMGYQQALTWLSGKEDLYDPENWKTKAYPNGHFNGRPFLHDRNGEAILFSRESFADLRMRSVSVNLNLNLNLNSLNGVSCLDQYPDAAPGPRPLESELTTKIDVGSNDISVTDDASKTHSVFIEDLYFVTKEGALDSVNSKALCWVLSKISCETQFDHDLLDLDAVEDLRLRVEVKHPQSLSTYELLSMYSENQVTDQLFIVSERKKEKISGII